MKLHEYNEMMSYVLRRRPMSMGGRPSLVDQDKFYEDIKKAYDKLRKDLGRNPTQGELLRATGRKSQTAIRTAEKKFGLKFFNKPGEYNVPKEVLQKVRKKQAKEAQAKKTITQPTTFQEEGVLKKVRFPNKKMEDAFKANVKLYYSFPQGSSEAKKAGATLDSFKNFYPDGVSDEVLRRHVYFYKDKLNLKFPKQEYEGQLKTQKIVNKRRENLIKEVSGFLQERQIGKAKRETGFGRAGENLDLAHRASLKQFKDFGLPYLTDNLGLDTKKLNQEILPPLEKEVNSLHRQRMKLIKGVEPGNVPKEVSKKLEDINIKLSNISMKTKGALQAVLLDEKTLKPFVFNKNYANVIGQGLIDKPVKDLSKADIDFIKSTFPQAAKTAKQGGPTLGANLGLLKGLGTAAEVAGTPAAAALFAADTVRRNIREGQSLADAAVDPLVGVDLLLPTAASRIAPGVMRGVLGLGKVGRAFTPIGAGLAVAGQAQEFYNQFQELQRLKEEDPEAYKKFIETRVTDPLTAEELADIEEMGREGAMYGGRMGFAEGPKDPGRRKFIKVMGGLASLPIIGKYFKLAEPISKAAPAVSEGIKLGADKLMMLVEKIKIFGKSADDLATQERQKVTKYEGKDGSEYELYEDLTTGDIRVEKTKPGVAVYGRGTDDAEGIEVIEDKSIFEIKKGRADETTKGKTPPDEYEEGRTVFDEDGTPADIDDVDDEVIKAIEDEIK